MLDLNIIKEITDHRAAYNEAYQALQDSEVQAKTAKFIATAIDEYLGGEKTRSAGSGQLRPGYADYGRVLGYHAERSANSLAQRGVLEAREALTQTREAKHDSRFDIRAREAALQNVVDEAQAHYYRNVDDYEMLARVDLVQREVVEPTFEGSSTSSAA